MAWTCSGRTNVELIQKLKAAAIIKSPRIEAAMLAVDRKNFTPRNGDPYLDAPQSIGYSATISAPHMHAHALCMLEEFLQPGMRALDVGSGSGYLTAIMGQLVGPSGQAVGIDHVKELVQMANENMKKSEDNQKQLDNGTVKFIVGDGRLGYAPLAPYNSIHVGAAAPEIPEKLITQLAKPGRLILPVGRPGQSQVYYQVDKSETGEVTKKPLMNVIFVPLVNPATEE